MLRRILLVLVVLFSGYVQAETYFLKFETSGVDLSASTLAADSNSWVKVSIVTAVAGDGNIHWLGGVSGSDVGYRKYRKTVSGTVTDNDTYTGSNKSVVYVADVPRSIRIKSVDALSSYTITAGGPLQQFDAAPSFLLPDGFIVSPGLQYYYYWNQNSGGSLTEYERIYIVADSAMKPYAKMTTCPKGWAFEQDKLKHLVYYTEANGTGYRCDTYASYQGSLTHVVKFD